MNFFLNEVACVQMNCAEGNMQKNAEDVIENLNFVKKSSPNVSLAVFPEMILYGYENLKDLRFRYTQEEIDFLLKSIADVCKELNMEAVLGAPYVLMEEQLKIKNALYFISSNGEFCKIYSKTNFIEEDSKEKNVFSEGESFSICKTSLGKTGFFACGNTDFCETCKTSYFYKKLGVDAIIVCAALEEPHLEKWKIAVQSRSLDYCVPIVATNRIGKTKSKEFFGHSLITDSTGKIIVENNSNKEGYSCAKISELKRKG